MCLRCEELEEQVRQLKSELYGQRWECPVEFHLTGQEKRFLAALVAYPGVRNFEFLFSTVSGGAANDDEPKRLITVIACRVRRKLKAFGVNIITHYAAGYSLDRESRARLIAWNEREAA